jgi:hypothetical protein
MIIESHYSAGVLDSAGRQERPVDRNTAVAGASTATARQNGNKKTTQQDRLKKNFHDILLFLIGMECYKILIAIILNEHLAIILNEHS